MKIEDKIVTLVKPEIDSFGVDLIDMELRGKPGSFRLSIFVDDKSGISVELCKQIAKKLSGLHELDKLLGDNYRLEVSSPGVGRPLKRIEDFQRKIGLELNVEYKIDEKGKKIKGKLLEVTDDLLLMKCDKNEVTIPFKSVTKAVQALPW